MTNMNLNSILLSVLFNLTPLIQVANCALFYPTNSAYGIFAAIAVPLDLPHRNVFISYNFEANYNLPINYSIPEKWEGFEDDTFFEEETRKLSDTKCTNCTSSNSTEDSNDKQDAEEQTTESHARKRRSLLTREHFYYILKDKFKRAGYNENTCLLRLICETNASMLGDNNGVLGNLLHIIFSPSTSEFENLPIEYYQAEYDGLNGDCVHYVEECRDNLLDLISSPLHEIVNRLMFNK